MSDVILMTEVQIDRVLWILSAFNPWKIATQAAKTVSIFADALSGNKRKTNLLCAVSPHI